MTDSDRLIKISTDIGYIKGKLMGIEDHMKTLPCTSHGEDIAQLKVKAGFWGGLTGAVSGFIASFLKGG